MTRAESLVVGFDLDMTLIDPRLGVAAAMTALEGEINAGIDIRWVVDNLGPPLETVLARWVDADQVEPAAWRYRELFEDLGIASTKAMPGALRAVQAVREAGGTVIVVTAKYERHARASLEAIGVSVDAVFGWLFGVAKGEALRSHRAALYVGDHPADVAAARAGNALAVMVASGAASIEELTAAGGDVLLESLEAFPGWLSRYLQTSA